MTGKPFLRLKGDLDLEAAADTPIVYQVVYTGK